MCGDLRARSHYCFSWEIQAASSKLPLQGFTPVSEAHILDALVPVLHPREVDQEASTGTVTPPASALDECKGRIEKRKRRAH